MNRQPLTVVEVDLEQLGKSVFEGEEFIPASPLAHWIARLGGYSGELPDPMDESRCYTISLEAFTDRDPDNTWLQVIVPERT